MRTVGLFLLWHTELALVSAFLHMDPLDVLCSDVDCMRLLSEAIVPGPLIHEGMLFGVIQMIARLMRVGKNAGTHS